MSSHSRRLEDRIRELCARVAASKDQDELNLILPELNTAIHQVIERVRIKAVAVLGSSRALPNERRKIP
jgi:nitrogen-specific signal transduction histidine kinase